MALATGCIFKPITNMNDRRICIMSRLTLNDGKTPDPRLDRQKNPLIFHDHWKEFAPPPQLVGAWYRSQKSASDWKNFAAGYQNYLNHGTMAGSINQLILLAKHRDIILLCVEETPELCHRRLLAEHCARIAPDLKVTIK